VEKIKKVAADSMHECVLSMLLFPDGMRTGLCTCIVCIYKRKECVNTI
jgi:hypothetical protein